MIHFYKNLKKISVISEEVIARDIEEFEKQKHLLNTPVQVNARILLVESMCFPHDPDWLNGLYCRLQKDVTNQLNSRLVSQLQLTVFTVYRKNKNKG
jgi:hypothetical protein